MNDTLARALLTQLSTCFQTRNLTSLLNCFSDRATATYIGSETGETATGRPALERLFTNLLQREPRYSFTFPHIVFDQHAEVTWLWADGHGVQTGPGPITDIFAYRICGVLVLENSRWRWALLTGSEPTPLD